MVQHVVKGRRLLKQYQVEGVHPFEKLHIGERVRRICIAHKADLAKPLAHPGNDVVVPVRRDLYLYAAIACIEFGLYLFQKLIDRILNSDRYPALYLVDRKSTRLNS